MGQESSYEGLVGFNPTRGSSARGRISILVRGLE